MFSFDSPIPYRVIVKRSKITTVPNRKSTNKTRGRLSNRIRKEQESASDRIGIITMEIIVCIFFTL